MDLTVDTNLGPPAAPPPTTNPLGTLSVLSEIQNRFNQNRLFQQQFAAKQRLGEIIATSPDPESGWNAALRDPLVAPFAGEAYAQYRAGQLTLQQLANTRQEGYDSGIKIALGGLAAGMSDPTQLLPNINARLALLPPENRAAVAPAIKAVTDSLLHGLPTDPSAARETFNQRLAGLGIGSGVMNPSGIAAILGTPTTQDVGGAIVSGTQLPPQLGGGFNPATTQPKTIAPQLTEPGKQPTGGAYETPTSNPSPNPVGGSPSGVGASGVPLDTMSSTGKPLFPPGLTMSVPHDPGYTGGLSPFHVEQASDLQKDFNGKEKEQYENAIQTKGQLGYIRDALDAASKAGGILEPGPLNGLRTTLAKLANTAAQATGSKPPIDPETVGKIEDANKITKWLGFNMIKQFEGASHDAAQTIQTGISSVPGLDNTVLGGHLMADSIEAISNNLAERRLFKQEWAARNGGNLTNADETFNREFPAQDYTKSVLSKYGLTDTGFTNPGAVKSALSSGLLTREQAKIILLKQFHDQFH